MTIHPAPVLREIPQLASLTETQLDLVIEQLTVQNYVDGHVFIQEGEQGNELFIILKGEVQITTSQSQTAQEVNRLGPAGMFGLMALLDDQPRSATCISIGQVTAAVLTRAGYQRLFNGDPVVALALQKALGAHLAHDFRIVAGVTRRLWEERQPAAPGPARTGRGDRPTIPGSAQKLVYDVVVMGGGPNGMIYATWIKRFRPKTRIAIIERRKEPGFKIGESTLSTTTRALLSMGLTLPIMHRLFGNKAGIRFWHMTPEDERPQCHVDVVDIEETFQVERRVLEIAMAEVTQRRGIDYFWDTSVNMKQSNLEGEVKQIVCRGPRSEPLVIHCRHLCDASGPSSVLPRHLKIYRQEPERYDTFQTNSYFAYFRQKKELPLDFWQNPATRHLCFPEGWVWFISLVSWEDSPTDKLQAMIKQLFNQPHGADEDFPSRQELAGQYGLSYEPITSIGITVRDDLDSSSHLSVLDRFNHYVEKYPALKWILDHYELVENPYTKRKPYYGFLALAHDCETVTGDGWTVIGDAGMFSNPLFSHGLNYGTGTAYMAAKATVEALNSGNFSAESYRNYQDYAEAIYPTLLHQTDMLYRSFRHVRSYERVLMMIFFFGAMDVLQRTEYSETDPFVFDLLNPEWQETVKNVRLMQKNGEEQGVPAADVADQVAAYLNPIFDDWLTRPELAAANIGSIFTHYTDEGVRVEDRAKPPGPFSVYHCDQCAFWVDASLTICPYCGQPNPKTVEGMLPAD